MPLENQGKFDSQLAVRTLLQKIYDMEDMDRQRNCISKTVKGLPRTRMINK